MSIETVRRTAERVADADLAADELSVIWHSGEPLTIEPAWYDIAVNVIREALRDDLVIRHYIQTNATLINDEWIGLFRKHAIHIGVSLDGPAQLHDARRRTRSGLPTHAKVMNGVRLLQDSGIGVHAICVLSREHLSRADEVLDFFLESGIRSIGFNLDEIDGVNAAASIGIREAALFRDFFTKIVTRYSADPSQFSIREIDRAVHSIVHHTDCQKQNVQNQPFGMLNVQWDGGVSTFSPELLGLSHPKYGNFIFGNVHQQSFSQVVQNEEFNSIATEIERGVENCFSHCPYFSTCRGGAPANKLGEHGQFDATATTYCIMMEMIVSEVVLSELRGMKDRSAGVRPGLDQNRFPGY